MSVTVGPHAVRAHDILSFWFPQDLEDVSVLERREGFWFGAGPEVDADIRRRFLIDIEAAARGEFTGLDGDARTRLAVILVTDQFPRHVYRGTAGAFSLDPVALRTCRDGLDCGHDRALHTVERGFFYLPLEHSEDPAILELHDKLTRQLAEDAPEHLRSYAQGFNDASRQHLAIIERFGRYPHRNGALGRPSTAAELHYLADGAERFGQ